MICLTKLFVFIYLSMTQYWTPCLSLDSLNSSPKPLSLREGRLDSYLSAYMDSKYQNTNAQVVLSTPVKESNDLNTEYGPPDNSQNEISDDSESNNNGDTSEEPQIPSTNYGVPDLNFTYRIPHQPSYPQQPKETVTQKPLTQYGPPKFYYTHPVKPVYGPPPPHQYGPPMMEMSRMPMMLHNLEGFANEFFHSSNNIKLVIAAGMKVLLKLLVFKFIIKFFTMIGLLLLIPKFDMGTMMMMDDGKNKSRTLISDETLDEFTKFVEESYEVLRSGGSIFPTCDEGEMKNSNMKIFCDLKRSAKSLNETFSFSKLFPTYLIQYLEQYQKGET